MAFMRKVLKVWMVPKGTIPRHDVDFYIGVSEDKNYWCTGLSSFTEGEIITFHCSIDEKHSTKCWENVRQYIINHLLPSLSVNDRTSCAHDCTCDIIDVWNGHCLCGAKTIK